MALIFLLILTILGVFGMNVSRLENLMAGNALFQTTALNDAEYTLSRGIDDVLDIKANDIPYPSGTHYHDVSDPGIDPEKLVWTGFTSASVAIPGGGTGSYIIENAGYEGTDVDSSMLKQFLPDPGGELQLFLVSAQSESARGAKRIVQSVVVIDPLPY
jgi:hypothetical protein